VPQGVRTYLPLLSLLVVVVAWIALKGWLFGALFAALFAVSVSREPPQRRRLYLALASSVVILALAPIHTDTSTVHFFTLGVPFVLAIAVPTAILWRERVVTFKVLPDRWEPLEVFYTLLSIPLAWGAFRLYFGALSPEVPFNWSLPLEPDGEALLRLFIGINLVGIWDELFFINVGYAVLRRLFPPLTANLAQAVLYTTVLWTMAFRGVGPVFVYLFALTQGAMYERSRALLWVLLVHLIVDYFLFQAIVEAYYSNFEVWWH